MSIDDADRSETDRSSDDSGVGGGSDVDAVDSQGVRGRLHDVVDPCSAATGSNLDIVEMGLVKSIDIAGGDVRIEMRLTSPMCHMVPYFYEEVEDRVGELPSVESVELETDAGFEWDESMMSEAAKRRRQSVLDEHASRYRSEQRTESTPSDR